MFKPNRAIRSESITNAHPFTDFPLLLASGLGRSGTTVLRNSLCAHPQIAGYNLESNYIHDLMRAADQNLEHKDRVKNMPVTSAAYWGSHRQLLLNLIWPVDQWAAAEDKKVISTYSMLDPRAAIGLQKTFPNLAICYIVRNGIEVVSSYLAFAAFKDLSFGQVCRLWALRFDMFEYASKHPHVFLFRHEWLNQPHRFKEHLSRALAFVGLPYHEQCESPLETVFHPTVFKGESGQESNDISRRSQRWKFWSNEQRNEFVELCGDAMTAQGYEIPWL